MERERERELDYQYLLFSRLPTGLFGHVKYCLISLCLHFLISHSYLLVNPALPCLAMLQLHSPKPVLYTFLFLLPHADDDGAERQRSDIPDTDASELVS